MKKPMASLLLTIGLLAGLLPTAAMAESHTATGVRYRAYNADSRCWNDAAICPSATVVSGTDTTWGDDGNDGWYVVNSNMTIDTRVIVSDTVHLILTDGCTLTVNGGIQVQGDWVSQTLPLRTL